MNRKNLIFIFFVTDIFLIYGLITGLGLIRFDRWRTRESKRMLTESQNTSDIRGKILLLQKASLLKPSEETYLKTGIVLMENGEEKLAGNYLKRVKTAEGYYQLAKAYYDEEKFTEAKKITLNSLDQEKKSKAYLLLGKIFLKEDNVSGANSSFREALRLENSDENRFYLALTSFLDEKNYQPTDLAELYSLDHGTVVNRTYAYLKTNSYPQTAYSFMQKINEKDQLNRDGYLYLANEQVEHNSYDEAYATLKKAKEKDMYFPQTYKHLILVCEKLGKTTEKKEYEKFLSSIEW